MSVVSCQFQRGFTLMEILVVIALLGILITVGLGSFKSSQQKSRDTRRKSDLRAISIALEAYYSDKGQYPNDALDGKIMGCGTNDQSECPWEGEFSDKNGTIYMVKLPGDPSGGRNYFYDVGPQNKSYQLYARLENKLDIDLQKDPSNNPYVYSGTTCGTSLACNYGVASANLKLTDQGHTLISE